MTETITEREQDFLKAVRQLARLFSWRCYHTWNSLKSEPGFPDIVLCKPGEPVIFIELKTAKGKLTEAQEEWLEALAQAKGTEVYCWRPSDWPEIEARLRGKGQGPRSGGER